MYVKPKKNLGQHFLTSDKIAQQIADSIDYPVEDGKKAINRYISEIQYDRDDVLSVEAEKAAKRSGVSETAEEVKDAVEEKASVAEEAVAEKAEDIKEAVEEKAEDIKEDIKGE